MMNPEIRIFATFLVALFSALFVMPKLAHIANRIGLVDRPNERKVHRIPRPLVGGIGIVISATFSALIFVPLHNLRGFFAGLALLLLVGFFDDFMEVGHRKKFLAQICATTLLMYLSKVYLSNFGDLLGIGDLIVPGRGWLIWVTTVFCVVGVTNAINMIDGLDGLAGGVAFIAFVSFTVLSSMTGNSALVLLNLSIAGAVLGFLKYNWAPASLFMGDAGSLCLGFALSFMAVALTQPDHSSIAPVTVLLVLAVPISDTITVMVRRMTVRRSPFSPDNTHLHHRLVSFGLDQKRAVVFILALCIVFSVLGIAGEVYTLPEPLLFGIFICYFSINFSSSWLGEGLIGLLKSLKRKEKPQHCPAVVHSVFKSLAMRRIFRGAERYRIHLGITCTSYTSEFALSGKILNVSRTGFMAEIKGLGFLCKECIIVLALPETLEKKILELRAEHLWSATIEESEYHGFKFVDLDGMHEATLIKLVESLRDEQSKV